MPQGISITLEGATGGPTPILDGSQNRVEGEGISYERILRAHDVRSSTIRHLVFQNGNYSGRGGAVKLQGDSAATIDDVTFRGNFARGGGGGLSVRPDAGWGPNTITNSVFEGRAPTAVELPNATPVGGALYIDTSDDVVLRNNRFANNAASFRGGAVAIQARGDVDIELAGNTFVDNDVTVSQCAGYGYGGGGLSIEGQPVFQYRELQAAAVVEGDTQPNVVQRGNLFDGNELTALGCTQEGLQAAAAYEGELHGGGELLVGVDVVSVDDEFLDNRVTNRDGTDLGGAEGAGLSMRGQYSNEEYSFTAHNLVLAGNVLDGEGEGAGAYFGGTNRTDVHLVHATVVANRAVSAGAGLGGGDGSSDVEHLVLENSIVYGNTSSAPEGGNPDVAGFDTVEINSSDVCTTGLTLVEGSGGNICEDPKLVDAAAGDVHQTAASPTLDAASNALVPAGLTKDYEGDERILDATEDGSAIADMGADERPKPVVVKDPEPEVQANVIAPGSIGEDDGYCQAAQDGGVFTFGGCQFFGAAGGGRVRASATDITAPQSLQKLNAPIVSIAMQPSDTGYWQAATDGGVFTFGTAPFLGSMGGSPLNNPINGIASSPTGQGYWLVASDGGVFSFGDAPFLGSMGGTPLNRPIVGIAATPSGKGYWLVASDGGVFSFGDAMFHGSTGGTTLNSPIVGMASRPAGLGYWLAAADGGVFTFGDAPFLGNRVGQALNAPITGIKGTSSGLGYWLIAGDGGIFSYGSAPFLGSMGNVKLNQPVVDMTG